MGPGRLRMGSGESFTTRKFIICTVPLIHKAIKSETFQSIEVMRNEISDFSCIKQLAKIAVHHFLRLSLSYSLIEVGFYGN